MMIGLKKCFGYGKLLKQLFITSLISCSFLLVNSFVSASDGYVPFGNTLNFGGNNCDFGNNLSFNCQKGGITLSNFLDNYMSSLFWLNDGIGFYYSPNPNNLDKTVRQGFINTGFYVCYGDTQTIIDNNWILTCPSSSSYCVNGFTPSGFMDYNSLVSLLTSKVPLYAYNPDGSNGLLYSLLYDDFYFIIYNSSSNYNVCGTFKNGVVEENVGITGNSLSNFTYGSNVLYSPLGVSPAPIPDLILTGDSEVVYYSDNNKVYYDFFECLGFTSDICYSNFSLDNVVDSNTTYFDLFPSGYISGATVFDLYNSWEYNFNPFNSWFNYYKSRYFNVESDKSNSSVLSMYSGDSKGNYYLFNKLDNSYYISSYSFNWQDYYIYCDMVVNGFNPDGLFTGKTSASFNNVFISSDVRSDNSICTNGQFNYYLSGSNFAFDQDTDIVGVFNKLYTQFKNAFYVDSSKVGTIGFLPRYIILGFFLFLLLYILKR